MVDVFKISKRSLDAKTQVIDLIGEIDVYTAPDLRDNLGETVDSGAPNLVINLESVRYIDSSGLSVLLETHKRTRARDGNMSVICNHTQILKLFSLTGLNKVLQVFGTEAEAVEAVSTSS